MKKKSVTHKNEKTKKRSGPKVAAAVPVAYSAKRGSRAATSMYGGPTGSLRVKRKEFVGTVTNGATTTFRIVDQSQSYPGLDINPAAGLMFPWLSHVAVKYERFRFHSLTLTLTAYAPTTQAGRVYMAVDYDFDDQVPSSKVAVLQNRSTCEGSIWESVSLRADPSALMADQPWKFCSSATRFNYVEPRTAFCGFVIIGIDTSVADTKFDLTVEYDVELQLPCTDDPLSGDSFGPDALPLAATAAVTSAQGGGFLRILSDTVPMVTPLLQKVSPGTAQCPLLSLNGVNIGATVNSIARLRSSTEGAIRGLCEYTVTGVTPANVMASAPRIAMYLYDYAGTFLGEPLMTTCRETSVVTGARDPTLVNTAGAVLRSDLTAGLKSLFATFPTAFFAYFALASSAALGAGTVKSGMTLMP